MLDEVEQSRCLDGSLAIVIRFVCAVCAATLRGVSGTLYSVRRYESQPFRTVIEPRGP